MADIGYTMYDVRAKRRALSIGKRTLIMGVLNVTPDSFSDGGRYPDAASAAESAKEMISQGADIIDIGGESSRPGSERISAAEEIRRVMPVIEALKGASVPVSIDTWKGEVARRALRAGADMVNDITALKGDPDMAGVIAEFDAAVVLMHMKGDPGDMQDAPYYDDVMSEICSYLSEASVRAEDAGIDPEKIIVDPGIGFGKTLEHNLMILKELGRLKEELKRPVLAGASRKSFIGEVTGKDVTKRVFGTAASVSAAVLAGADIVRVHDVGEMADVVRVADAIRRV